MKKLMFSLLLIAATFNATAVTYSGKATVTLKSSDNKSCAVVIATSNDLVDGLNPEYYAALNDEGKSVLLYVDYEGTRYSHFGTSETTMRNMPLVMKANSATDYRFLFSNLEGAIEIYDTKLDSVLDKSQVYNFTIEDSERDANNIIADRFIINYVPAPVYSVTTNIDGWASYSSDVDLVAPTGLTVYAGTIDDKELILTSVNYIKANEGVIVKGEASQTYTLTPGSGSDSYTNDLKPSSAWANHSGTIYCLRNEGVVGTTAFYQYTGSDMPANKAYLQISATPSSAPKRISMRFNQPTAIENVELEAVKAEKFIENGQVLIKRGEIIYNVQGQIVK